MITIRTTFTRAATGKPDVSPGISLFWLMVFAVAIDDDAQRREKEQRRKRQAAAQPQRKAPLSTPKPL